MITDFGATTNKKEEGALGKDREHHARGQEPDDEYNELEGMSTTKRWKEMEQNSNNNHDEDSHGISFDALLVFVYEKRYALGG